jgi:hypothetical protein
MGTIDPAPGRIRVRGRCAVAPDEDDVMLRAAGGLLAGCGAVIAVGMIVAGTLPAHDLMARAVLLASVAGAAAAMIERWWAAAGVTVFAALVFVGFLAHRYGVLTGDPSAWPDSAVIASAALLGQAGRRLRTAAAAAGASARSVPAARVTDGVAAGYLIEHQG